MSQASLPFDFRSATASSEPRVVDDHAEVDALFSLLEDDDCRCILDATDGVARSASELSEACDLPLSTTYRKLDPLADAGLLSKRLRISRSGAHTAEYERTVDDVTVSVTPSGVEVRVSHRDVTESASVTA
ncbi:helix-turn-helix domain-containing protein [Haloferax sp. KTX1]|uniref:winged helix-turn-helix domain-containing protein n=1 Tax=Haloferax sp. KTX1 TaxID=2600597 RepID=UPI0011DD9C7C|nr:helix-turn-helix domain-containing protein [Haloferax sp. KTX1]